MINANVYLFINMGEMVCGTTVLIGGIVVVICYLIPGKLCNNYFHMKNFRKQHTDTEDSLGYNSTDRKLNNMGCSGILILKSSPLQQKGPLLPFLLQMLPGFPL